MTMDRQKGLAAVEVESYSKQGAQRLQEGQTKKAVEAFQRAFNSAQILGHNGYLQRACAFNLGASLISTGKFSDGLVYLNHATPPEGTKDGRSLADLYFNFGLAYEGLKNLADSIKNFEKAQSEYRFEGNVRMEIDVIQRLVKLYRQRGQSQEIKSSLEHLMEMFEKLEEKEKLLQVKVELANVLLELNQADVAAKLADECLEARDDAPNIVSGSILMELGVIYTKIFNFDKAVSCSQQALALIQPSHANTYLVAVLYQNLGAEYNHKAEYQTAIQYHSKAAENYASLNNRKCQGHCFLNMGFAYSQLKDMEKAKESFLHAHQAAKDCGDKKTEWQSLESLGAVAYNQRAFTKAYNYYLDAFFVVGQSPQSGDARTQDRLKTKLKHISEQINRPAQQAEQPTYQENLTERTEDPSYSKEPEIALKKEDAKAVPQTPIPRKRVEGKVFALKRGGQTKFIKVRRSGTLRRFHLGNVAGGLDTTRSSSPVEIFDRVLAEGAEELTPVMDLSQDEEELEPVEDNMDTLPNPSLNEVLEINEDNGKKFIKLKTSGRLKRFCDKDGCEEVYEVLESDEELPLGDEYYHSESESKDDNGEDEESDKKRHARPLDSFTAGSSRPFDQSITSESIDGDENIALDEEEEEEMEKKQVLAAMQQLSNANETQVHADVHAEPETSSDESDSGDDEDDDDDESTPRQKEMKPPMPSLSPAPTAAGTYEKSRSQALYETVDHKPPTGKEDKKQVTIGETQSTIYDSIRPQTSMGTHKPDADKIHSDESGTDTEELSRGEKDRIQFESFRSERLKEKEGSTSKEEKEKPIETQKSKKVCRIM